MSGWMKQGQKSNHPDSLLNIRANPIVYALLDTAHCFKIPCDIRFSSDVLVKALMSLFISQFITEENYDV